MRTISSGLRVCLVMLLVTANTLPHALVLFAMAAIRLLAPTAGLRRACGAASGAIAESWIGVNNAMIGALTPTVFTVSVDASLRRDGRYLVLANHQSWVDILVLQKIFNRRIPLLRFFLKRELFWVPVLGLCWWALDFPFMRRHTREQIERRPELAGRDIETTRRACAKFRDVPVAIMNFVEGTRFTPAKHDAQASPYRHLLKPRSGGVAFVLDAMGDALEAILDVTIVYPAGHPTMVDLFAGRIAEVRVEVRQRAITRDLVGDYQNDAEFRERFQQWMNALWAGKDATFARLLGDPR